jgi:hypothetical protein
VALSDLGGLGAKEGSPVAYEWLMPSVAPVLLPWLMILALLVMKPNRNAAAWWVWLPLGCVMAFIHSPPINLPSSANFFLDVFAALAFGLAAVWLLLFKLRQAHRFVTFLSVLLALAVFSALAFVVRMDWSGLSVELLPICIMLAIAGLATAAALSLAGWICRKRYSQIGVYLWTLVSILVIWLLIASPFILIALASSGGGLELNDMLLPVLSVALGNFATVLPFLILSSASPFYRERLKALLHVKPEAPPVLADAPVNVAI